MLTEVRAKPLSRSLAFLAGVGFAAVPAVGPFLALLAIATGRIELQRADRWWWFAAVLLGLPYLFTGHPWDALSAAAQVLAAWLIFRSATEIRRGLQDKAITEDVGAGLVVGLALTLALGLRQFDGFRWETARTALDAITWQAHPAIFGHTMLVLAALLAVVVPSPRLRVVALVLGAAGVVLSGAWEAVFAWLLIAVGLRFVGRRGSRLTNIAEWALVVVMVLFVTGAFGRLGLGRTGFLTDLTQPTQTSNLFRGTEVIDGDWWYPLGVSASATNVNVAGTARSGLTVTKQWNEPWARLQQIVTLQPGETYNLSAAWRTTGSSAPGFDGWGRRAGAPADTVLSSSAAATGHRATGSGGIAVLSSSTVDLGGSWTRGLVSFRYDGDGPLVWYLGVVPDRSNLTGVSTTFAELQLTASDALQPYTPGHAERGVTSLRASRFPVWRDALTAIAARPLVGWGPGGLPTAVEELLPGETRVRPVGAHAHNIVLAVWVDRGLLGVIGLAALVIVLALRAIQQRDRAMAVVLAGVVVLNLFDATLFSGTVIYPLAAVLGWRALGRRQTASAETGVGSATVVRAALALGDAAAGAASISLGLLIASRLGQEVSLASGWSPALGYATLLWPLVAGWSGLYPGYGRPAHEELGRSVRVGAAAALVLAFVTIALPQTFALPATIVLLTTLASVILTPAFRSLTKLLLQFMRLWGRPVVVLGTSASAERTAAHLLAHPGVGLHPVAAFGDGGSWSLARLPVTGNLESAWRYIVMNNVRHAIVAPDAARELAFDEVLRHAERQLKHVQYLPDLSGLPSSSVVAAPLGTSLALEVRNELASGTNRALKRAVDIAVSGALLVILGLPLLVVAALIRLDSPGPAFLRSPRVGRHGRTFNCVKFRTMTADAEERLARMLERDEAVREEYERYRKLTNDPRVTQVGKLLRRVSFDEFPQLLNVVLGDMSLVGPRPYLVSELADMGSDRDLIFLARPGLTGYWQVGARNDVSFAERQAMEAHYVRNWSFWWDVEILLRTPGAMLTKGGR